MSNYSLVYLLDTNVCIMYLKGKSPSINNRLDSLNVKDFSRVEGLHIEDWEVI